MGRLIYSSLSIGQFIENNPKELCGSGEFPGPSVWLFMLIAQQVDPGKASMLATICRGSHTIAFQHISFTYGRKSPWIYGGLIAHLFGHKFFR
jgi:hypothetical protein